MVVLARFKNNMLQKIFLFCLIGIVSSSGFSQNLEKETIRLFFLGGQSNMKGHGLNAELPDSLSGMDCRHGTIIHIILKDMKKDISNLLMRGI